MPTTTTRALQVLGAVTVGAILLTGCSGTAEAEPVASATADDLNARDANADAVSVEADTMAGSETAALKAGDIVPTGIADTSFESGKWPYQVADGTRYVVESDKPLPEPVLEDMKADALEDPLSSPDGDTDDHVIFVLETYGSPPSTTGAGGDTFWTIESSTEATDAVNWEGSDGTMAWATSEAERIVAASDDPNVWRIVILTFAG